MQSSHAWPRRSRQDENNMYFRIVKIDPAF